MAELAILGVAALPAGALLVVGGLAVITGVVIIVYGQPIMSQIGAISSTSFSLPNIRNQLGFIDEVNNNPNTITLESNEEQQRRFKHDKHKNEWDPPISYEEYNQRWEEQNEGTNPNIESNTRYDGTTVTYNPDTNEFGVKNPPGRSTIFETFFRPKQGAFYYYKDLEIHHAIERAFTNMEDH